jgi:hypothetical protein
MIIPDPTDIAVVMILMLAVGGGAVAWGVARYQSEGSWVGGAVAALGLLIAIYAPLSAMFGWPPLEWLRS